MILLDIFDTATWWTLLIAIQVIIGTYYLWAKKFKKTETVTDTKPKFVEWEPLPLVEYEVTIDHPPLMDDYDDSVVNVGATSFLCMDKEKSIEEAAIKSLHKYGVGSCGPRGFYGTLDVHLELEERLARFMEVEETCVYAYGFSTVASAIPAYCKKNDIIFADIKVWFAIQRGLDAARSTVRYFKHNDMEDLETKLQEAADEKELNPKRRAFVVVEGIYFNTGEMCPLKKVVELARRFKLRIILDESLSIGVLGKHGRGITEHFKVPRDEIDMIIGSLENSFASIGGFCAGTHFFVEHQRLSGLGYCFSASLPPMLTQAAISALDMLEAQPEILVDLATVSRKLNKELAKFKHFVFRGDELSPVKHIYLKGGSSMTERLQHTYLRDITAYALEKGVAFAVAAYLRDTELDGPEPSIRLAANRKLTDENIVQIREILDEGYEQVGPKPGVFPTKPHKK